MAVRSISSPSQLTNVVLAWDKTVHNGTSWKKLTSGAGANILALEVFNDKRYVGGTFQTAGGISSPHLAVWTSQSSGIESDDFYGSFINIFPNPSEGKFVVNGISRDTELTIYDMAGNEMTYRTLTSRNTEVDLSQLKKGIYIFKLNKMNRSSHGFTCCFYSRCFDKSPCHFHGSFVFMRTGIGFGEFSPVGNMKKALYLFQLFLY